MLKLNKYNKDGEFLYSFESAEKLPLSTEAELLDTELKDNEYFAFVDKNGNVVYHETTEDEVRCVIKTRNVKVTAYHKQTQAKKEFDDAKLVTDDYTLIKPESTQKWSDEKNKWVDDDEKIIAINQTQSKITRDAYINSNITLKNTEAQYQADAGSIENIKRTIELANTLNLADDDSQGWKLADNTWRETTLSEIKQVHTQYLLRFKKAYELLAIWESGDMLEPFVINE